MSSLSNVQVSMRNLPFRADKPVVMEIYWNFHTQGIRNVKTGGKNLCYVSILFTFTVQEEVRLIHPPSFLIYF